MSWRIDIELDRLERAAATKSFLQRFGAECIRQGQKLASERIGGGTGAYERGFRVELLPGDPPRLAFGNIVRHAIHLEDGTKAHTVVPVRKKALRWFDPPGGGEGAAVFSQRAEIPAMEGRHIVRDAVSRAADRLLDK